MASFDTNNLSNIAGAKGYTAPNARTQVNGGRKGDLSLLAGISIDEWGNLYSPPSGPWEMQVGAVETVGQDQGHITAGFVSNCSGFSSYGCTGYLDGVVSGAGTWTIQAGPQTIGGVSYTGGGLIVATANNSVSTTALQAGTHLQLGTDASALTGSIRTTTVASGAVLDIFGGNTTAITKIFGMTNAAGGTVNWKGPNVCGAGVMQNSSATYNNNGTTNIDGCIWDLISGFTGAATGAVNISDGATFGNGALNVSSSNTFNINGCGWCDAAGVKQGALRFRGNTSFSNKINVQSASCIKNTASVTTELRGVITGSAPLTLGTLGTGVNGVFHVFNTANTYSGTLTMDSCAVNASYGTSMQYAKVVLANGAWMSSTASQTVGSLASADATTRWQSADFNSLYIKNNGVTTYAGKLIWNGGSNTANFYLEGPSTNQLTMTGTGNTGNIWPRNGARLILQGATWTGTNGQVRVATGATVSAGTSTTAACQYLLIDATSKLEVRAVGAGCGLLNVGTVGLGLAAGWKVDLPDAMAPGVYPILKNAGAASTVLPTTGVNNTGRTVIYAWNNAVAPKTLNMTLV